MIQSQIQTQTTNSKLKHCRCDKLLGSYRETLYCRHHQTLSHCYFRSNRFATSCCNNTTRPKVKAMKLNSESEQLKTNLAIYRQQFIFPCLISFNCVHTVLFSDNIFCRAQFLRKFAHIIIHSAPIKT